MDRSFLADKDVISASRKFVCIRLATYENAEENKILAGFFSRGGVLENTVFTLLTPDGKTKLVSAGRSPVWAFGGVRGAGINAQPEVSMKKMGQTMEAIALVYPGKGKAAKGFPPLPYLADLRLAHKCNRSRSSTPDCGLFEECRAAQEDGTGTFKGRMV